MLSLLFLSILLVTIDIASFILTYLFNYKYSSRGKVFSLSPFSR